MSYNLLRGGRGDCLNTQCRSQFLKLDAFVAISGMKISKNFQEFSPPEPPRFHSAKLGPSKTFCPATVLILWTKAEVLYNWLLKWYTALLLWPVGVEAG